MTKILLPQGYLSQLQIVMWKNDREKYIRKYILREEDNFTNSGIKFGKTVSDALEGKGEVDILTEGVVSLLPKYDSCEQEITVEMSGIPLLGKLDTFNTKTFEFREYKTGRRAWTSRKAHGSFQMWFYAMLVYLKHKKVLHEAYLDWAETEEVNGVVSPTGKIESFRVVFTLTGILETMATTSKVAKEISQCYQEELQKLV